MELKQFNKNLADQVNILLIVPYGIETFIEDAWRTPVLDF